VYFPLHKGDTWNYNDFTTLCEGTYAASTIIGDTIFNNHTYAVFRQSVFGAHFVRTDSNRVYVYDTTYQVEFVMFDFSANPGDTISILNKGTRIIIALSAMAFIDRGSEFTNDVYSIRDSIGITSVANGSCYLALTSAFINGKKAYPTSVGEIHITNIPDQPFLDQNFPNPFNSSTTIRFLIPSEQEIALDVLNQLGQSIESLARGKFYTGWHQLTWDAGLQSSGIYYIRLNTNKGSTIRSALLIK
jgi:hypothetical protein